MKLHSIAIAAVSALAVSACAVYTPAPVYTSPAPVYTTPAPTVYTAPAAYPSAVGWYQDPAYGPVYVGYRPTVGYYYMGGPSLSVSLIGRPIPHHYHSRFHYYHGHAYRGWRR